MRVNRYLVAALVVACLTLAGCWYKRPKLDEMYTDVKVGMTKDEVVELLDQPTAIIESEMFYLYDDPLDPVRFRFVLDDKGIVVEKYYETKKELAKKAEETKGQVPPVERMPGEPGRSYPGGPLERFERKPGEPEKMK
ncbi:MAG TPA: hypothetical protein VM431_13055 [Phycisphaerae bacterium]|nr:hypothetical protein [Phycisphaerae bacterium]